MEKLIEFLLYLQGPVPYAVAFIILLACGFGLPIPEDITLFAMGILSYYGLADLKVSILICFSGVMLGDTIIFLLGKMYGDKLTEKGVLAKVLHPERKEKIKSLFLKWGNKLIFAARFMPGLRTPIFFSAGVFKVPFRVFFFYDGLAAAVSVPALIYVVYRFGDHLDWAIQKARTAQHGMLAIIFGVIILFSVKYFITKKREASSRA